MGGNLGRKHRPLAERLGAQYLVHMHSFAKEVVDAGGCSWDEAAKVNNALSRLAAQCVERVDLSDPILARSKLAWKVAIVRQVLTHRLVDLTSSTCLEFNAGNSLACVVVARAAFETCALIEYAAQNLSFHLKGEDLPAINELLTTTLFGTRNPRWLANGESPKALNILTAIEKLDRTLEGAAAHYDRLSDIAHPNSQGTHQFYATTNYDDASVSFRREKRTGEQIFAHVVAAVGTVSWARRRLEELDDLAVLISELQHRVSPRPSGGSSPPSP